MLSLIAFVLSLVALVFATWALYICLHLAQGQDRR
jgi:hypothetical protein